jgi:hypothetical protein
MSQLVNTKRQVSFKDFKRFGGLMGSSNKKKKRRIQLVRV